MICRLFLHQREHDKTQKGTPPKKTVRSLLSQGEPQKALRFVAGGAEDLDSKGKILREHCI